MSKFAEIKHTSNADEVNEYLTNGWDLIDTAQKAYGDGSFVTQHILGLSYKAVAEGLLTIVKAYEEHGLKEELLSKMVDDEGDTAERYVTNGFFSDKNDLAKFLVKYEALVNKKEVTFYKSKKSEAPILDNIETDLDF